MAKPTTDESRAAIAAIIGGNTEIPRNRGLSRLRVGLALHLARAVVHREVLPRVSEWLNERQLAIQARQPHLI